MLHLCNCKPEIIGSKHKVTIVGNLAVWIDKYSLKSIMQDGNPIEMSGATSCIMKKNDEGFASMDEKELENAVDLLVLQFQKFKAKEK